MAYKYILILFLLLGACKSRDSRVQDAGLFDGEHSYYIYRDLAYQNKYQLSHPEIRVRKCPEGVIIKGQNELSTKLSLIHI